MLIREDVNIDIYSLSGNVNDVVSYLQKWRDKLPIEFRDEVYIDIDYETGYYGSVNLYAKAYYMRSETEEETQKRLNRDKAVKEKADERDRYLFEQLKKKFKE